jgi:hypothetical protein
LGSPQNLEYVAADNGGRALTVAGADK